MCAFGADAITATTTTTAIIVSVVTTVSESVMETVTPTGLFEGKRILVAGYSTS